MYLSQLVRCPLYVSPFFSSTICGAIAGRAQHVPRRTIGWVWAVCSSVRGSCRGVSACPHAKHRQLFPKFRSATSTHARQRNKPSAGSRTRAGIMKRCSRAEGVWRRTANHRGFAEFWRGSHFLPKRCAACCTRCRGSLPPPPAGYTPPEVWRTSVGLLQNACDCALFGHDCQPDSRSAESLCEPD